MLQLKLPLRRDGMRAKSDTWRYPNQSVNSISGSIVDFIGRFGGTRGPIPTPRFLQSMEIALERRDALQCANLCYYTLTRLAKLEITWVDSVCLHLELDSRH